MPINEALDATMTTVQRTAINGALDTIITTLIAVGDVHLSAEERQNTPSVDANREPFVEDCITNLAVNFPGLAGQDIAVSRATNNWRSAMAIKGLRAKLGEVLDRFIDLEVNTENIALRFMDDYYDNCKRYKDRNVAGAESGYDKLSDYYSRFGNPGGTPPVTPP